MAVPAKSPAIEATRADNHTVGLTLRVILLAFSLGERKSFTLRAHANGCAAVLIPRNKKVEKQPNGPG